MQLKSLFNFFIDSQDTSAFGLPIELLLNKNCLFKFDNSILSLSVIYKFLFLFVDTPIAENVLRNSHPKAPAPIIKIFASDNFFCN